MPRISLLWICLLLMTTGAEAQYRYEPLRIGYMLDGLGYAPVSMASLDLPFLYRRRAFESLQTGIGFILKGNEPKLSSAISLTHNYLLNPYKRNDCAPQPGHNRIETFFEAGLVISAFSPNYGGFYRELLLKTYVRPGLVIGLRHHILVRDKLLVLKFRFTPLFDRAIIPWAGISLGIGVK